MQTKAQAKTVKPILPTQHTRPAGQVRIIGGQWKRTPLTVVSTQGLRPTPDRVRETLFNWLEHLFAHAWSQRVCLDLFAGSGALGFEAASRGAAQVHLCEIERNAYAALQAVQKKLQATQVVLYQQDALPLLDQFSRASSQFDLIFLDPPFAQDFLTRVLPLMVPLLKPDGLLYVESEMALTPLEMNVYNLCEVRTLRAGVVHAQLLQRAPTP